MANDYSYVKLMNFAGGLCDQPERAQTNQVLACENVWAPNLVVEQRPGLQLWQTNLIANFSQDPIAATSMCSTPSGSSFIDFTAFATGANPTTYGAARTSTTPGCYWYIKTASTAYGYIGFHYTLSASGTANTTVDTKLNWEYYNGTGWVKLYGVNGPIVSVFSNAGGGVWPAQGLFGASLFPCAYLASTGTITVRLPPDIAQVSVNSTTGYWIRAEIVGSDVSNSYSEAISNLLYDDNTLVERGAIVPLFFAGYTSLLTLSTPPVQAITPIFLQQLNYTDAQTLFIATNSLGPDYPNFPFGFPVLSITHVKEFGTSFITTADNVVNFRSPAQMNLLPASITPGAAVPGSSSTTGITTLYPLPLIETDPGTVGTLPTGGPAPLNPSIVPQLSGWPKTKLHAWFDGLLWAANIDGVGGSAVMWSAPSNPFIIGYRVWPLQNIEYCVTTYDASDISALFATDEYLMVFKGQTIWKMIPANTGQSSQPIYTPVQITDNAGTMAPMSIVSSPLGVCFLYDDGFYLLQGTQPVKISANINNTVADLNRYKFPEAWGCHWRVKHCVLWAVAEKGSDVNNLILCWDYTMGPTGAWWVWRIVDSIGGIQNIFAIDDNNDVQQIYCGNYFGDIFTFTGNVDNYESMTDVSFTTHRIGYDDPSVKVFSQIRVMGENTNATLNVTTAPDDRSNVAAQTVNFVDINEDVYDATTSTFGTAEWAADKRRTPPKEIRATGLWATITIQNPDSKQPMKVNALQVGVIADGTQ